VVEPAATNTPRLVPVSAEPWNAETDLTRQAGLLTPIAAFYKRNHFPIPRLALADWRLHISGAVTAPRTLTYADLLALPRRSLVVTLECAGNGRTGFTPAAVGEPWGYGAVSTAEWTGTPLREALAAAAVSFSPSARELVFWGADAGHVDAANATLAYARSLPLEVALHPDTLLAYAMNGEPLPAEHGFPLRLIVPGWYGMAAVKWLARIDAVAEPFTGFYQVERYVLTHPERGDPTVLPLGAIGVRALFTSPSAGATLRRGPHLLRGLAWSGGAAIAAVEVSGDDGASWQAAELLGPELRYAWRPWELRWEARELGPATLRCRARDALGALQPDAPDWNQLGYANNAVVALPVVIA
jgi:DMSO/TMAO reductase YedYZ molybdopterin-dependent catalytic subunit